MPEEEWRAEFPGGPPGHVNCRCSSELTMDDEATIRAEALASQTAREKLLREKVAGEGRAETPTQDVTGFGESWRGALSEKENTALDEYQGTTYRTDNAILRRSVNQPDWEPPESWYEARSGKLGGADRIDTLTEALNRATTPEEYTAYRGFAGTKTGDAMAQLQPGQTFTDWGFASTSTNQEYALREFGGHGEISAARITVPQGSRAAYLTRAAEAETMKEWELLIQRGAKFEVEGFDTIGDKRIINLRLTETAPGKFWRSADEWWDEVGEALDD